MTSWKPEVIADSSGKWTGNGCRFATHAEAERYVIDLASRWTAVRETRVTECPDTVTCAIIDDRLEWLKAETEG